MCGATLASANGRWSVIHWAVTNPISGKVEGVWPKVVVPMFASPLCGVVAGFLLMLLLYLVLHRVRPRIINLVFGKLQLVSAA